MLITIKITCRSIYVNNNKNYVYKYIYNIQKKILTDKPGRVDEYPVYEIRRVRELLSKFILVELPLEFSLERVAISKI